MTIAWVKVENNKAVTVYFGLPDTALEYAYFPDIIINSTSVHSEKGPRFGWRIYTATVIMVIDDKLWQKQYHSFLPGSSVLKWFLIELLLIIKLTTNQNCLSFLSTIRGDWAGAPASPVKRGMLVVSWLCHWIHWWERWLSPSESIPPAFTGLVNLGKTHLALGAIILWNIS